MSLKIVVLGDEAVGKTSLLADKFLPFTKITLEPNKMTRQFTVNDQVVDVEFWDMPGRRENKSWMTSDLRDTDCCVIVYDITSLESFESLEYWRKEFLNQISPSDVQWFPLIVVVGNKTDSNHRMVDEDMIASWCSANEVFLYFELSAKTPADVSDALYIIVFNAFNNKFKRVTHETYSQSRQNVRSFCCSLFSCSII